MRNLSDENKIYPEHKYSVTFGTKVGTKGKTKLKKLDFFSK